VQLACDGSEVVVRFPPYPAQRLRENAEGTFADDIEQNRRPPRYGVSVLATQCREGETIEDAVQRVCMDTGIGKRSKSVAVTTGARLREYGFDVVADPTSHEPRHHLVGEDPFSALPDCDTLESLLKVRMQNPAWNRSAA